MRWLAGLPLFAAAAAVATAAAAFLWPPRKSRASGFTDLGPVDEIPEGVVVRTLESGPIVVLKEAGQCRAFSAACTHLGCPVRWRPEAGEFFCSCHGGAFDRGGKPLRGPVRSPLKALNLRITGGRLLLEESS
ncbi:MAG: Rieske (2Fe-2S) protein [Planctomycetes bacterium]|nr:Rieske (2Fe-2S) protein [Planctomycetota bacterium]